MYVPLVILETINRRNLTVIKCDLRHMLMLYALNRKATRPGHKWNPSIIRITLILTVLRSLSPAPLLTPTTQRHTKVLASSHHLICLRDGSPVQYDADIIYAIWIP